MTVVVLGIVELTKKLSAHESGRYHDGPCLGDGCLMPRFSNMFSAVVKPSKLYKLM